MARHKQCQKLGESRNADLTAPQGVAPQTLLIHNTTKLLQREGGWVTKLLELFAFVQARRIMTNLVPRVLSYPPYGAKEGR